MSQTTDPNIVSPLGSRPLAMFGYPEGVRLDDLNIVCGTGQPDLAMVVIRYRGRPLDRGGLDINPCRSSGECPAPGNTRQVRQ